MRTETEIRQKGVQALLQTLGDVDAERFFALMQRQPFDYTQWQQGLWLDEDIDTISDAATKHRHSKINRSDD